MTVTRLIRRHLLVLNITAAACVAAAGCGSDSSSGGTASKEASSKPYRVSVLQLAQIEIFDQMTRRFQARLRQRLAPRRVDFSVANAQGDPSLLRDVVRQQVRSRVDAFAVLGTDAVVAMSQAERRRPVIAVAMTDPVAAKVAKTLDQPAGNVTGSVSFMDPGKVLRQISRTAPPPRRLGTIVNPASANDSSWLGALKRAASARRTTLVQVSISSAGDVPAAARSLLGRVDGILLPPDAVIVSAVPAIGSLAASRKLPLYLTGGDASVRGVLAQVGPDFVDLAALAADSLGEIVVGGRSAGDVAFKRFGGDPKWTLNSSTAKALTNLRLPPDVTAAASP